MDTRRSTVICRLAHGVLATAMLALAAQVSAAEDRGEITLCGSMVCNGACIPDPKPTDHHPVLYAIDGTPQIHAEIVRLMEEFYPAKGLDAAAAEKLMNEFTARLKYHIDPESAALRNDPGKGKAHYCHGAEARAVTGVVSVRDGQRWITASRIEPAKLKYPAQMRAADKPLAMPEGGPLVLKIGDGCMLKCVPIPPGEFLMGTPFYMWPYFVEEYPHRVKLTRGFYMAEIPVTQAMYQAVMADNPSTVKDPQLPVQDPRFADIDRFCQLVSEKNGQKVRLPTDAEWEYAARVGTSNPPLPEKYREQNSSGESGFKSPLKVRSKQPNAWGLYDMASCWWEITADRGMYNVRKAEVDPSYPPSPGQSRVQRSGRGIVKDEWSVATHEFITEKGYAGQKFRIVVDADAPPKRTKE